MNSRHPIITVETPEEERVEQLLFDIANELSVPLYTWSVTTGLAKMRGAPIYNTDNPDPFLAAFEKTRTRRGRFRFAEAFRGE